MRRTYRYRIYPTAAQAQALESQLRDACDLYNAALQQRRDAWREQGVSITGNEQQLAVKELRAGGLIDPSANSWSQAEALVRLDRAFQAFFRRTRDGEAPGFPRFRSAARYDTLTWSFRGHGGCKVREDGRLSLQAVGAVRVRWHRPLPADAALRQVAVTRTGGKWYAGFSVETASKPLPATDCAVGIDLGISTFAATSNGELLVGPRAYRKTQAQLRVAQRRVARRQRGSSRRRKAAQQLARKHEHIRRVRADHAHKLAHGLVNDYDFIALENLNIRGLAQMALAKDVHDQGWAQFVQHLSDKAECAGRTVVLVDPKNTSQECSGCGEIVRKSLSQRVHSCACGLTLDRDVNAARNILARGLGQSPQAPTVGEGPCGRLRSRQTAGHLCSGEQGEGE